MDGVPDGLWQRSYFPLGNVRSSGANPAAGTLSAPPAEFAQGEKYALYAITYFLAGVFNHSRLFHPVERDQRSSASAPWSAAADARAGWLDCSAAKSATTGCTTNEGARWNVATESR